MTSRELRLRERIDALSDKLERAETRVDNEVRARMRHVAQIGNLTVGIRARDKQIQRLRDEVAGERFIRRQMQSERDEALALLWAERDMSTRKAVA